MVVEKKKVVEKKIGKGSFLIPIPRSQGTAFLMG